MRTSWSWSKRCCGARAAHPLTIGDAVLVGPHTHLNGTTVENEVFVATGVSMSPGSTAGAGSELRINSVLHVNSALPPGTGYGVPRGTSMREIMSQQCEAFGPDSGSGPADSKRA